MSENENIYIYIPLHPFAYYRDIFAYELLPSGIDIGIEVDTIPVRIANRYGFDILYVIFDINMEAFLQRQHKKTRAAPWSKLEGAKHVRYLEYIETFGYDIQHQYQYLIEPVKCIVRSRGRNSTHIKYCRV